MHGVLCVYLAQLRYQKRKKAASLPKISINIFDVSNGRGSVCVCVLCVWWEKVLRET